MIPDTDLDEMQKRCDAATPGPWVYTPEGKALNWACIAFSTASEHDISIHPVSGRPDPYDFVEEDATHIAHSRTDLPATIAEVRRHRAHERRALQYLAAGDLRAAMRELRASLPEHATKRAENG